MGHSLLLSSGDGEPSIGDLVARHSRGPAQGIAFSCRAATTSHHRAADRGGAGELAESDSGEPSAEEWVLYRDLSGKTVARGNLRAPAAQLVPFQRSVGMIRIDQVGGAGRMRSRSAGEPITHTFPEHCASLPSAQRSGCHYHQHGSRREALRLRPVPDGRVQWVS
jgi:hypothetical protein